MLKVKIMIEVLMDIHLDNPNNERWKFYWIFHVYSTVQARYASPYDLIRLFFNI